MENDKKNKYEEYINFIKELLTIARKNEIFFLTSREFNRFEYEVIDVLEKEWL